MRFEITVRTLMLSQITTESVTFFMKLHFCLHDVPKNGTPSKLYLDYRIATLEIVKY